jgi:hypothetical protein
MQRAMFLYITRQRPGRHRRSTLHPPHTYNHKANQGFCGRKVLEIIGGGGGDGGGGVCVFVRACARARVCVCVCACVCVCVGGTMQ